MKKILKEDFNMTTETKNALLGCGIIGVAFMLGNKYGYAKGGNDAYSNVNKTLRKMIDDVIKKFEEIDSEEEA